MNFKKILIQPYELKDYSFKERLDQKLIEIFRLPVIWLPDRSVPYRAYNLQRNQFLGDLFLLDLANIRDESDLALGIVPYDLYEEGLNFVFGVASSHTKTAVVSTYRLYNSFYGLPEDPDLFTDRVIKEAVHELGHVLGLGHCLNPECVMYFSNSIYDTDRKSYYFCRNCYEKIKSILRF